MPLHDFACGACGHEFEAFAEAGAGATCPVCGANGARRLWRPILPTPRFGLRGRAARTSNAHRAEREAKRRRET